MFEKTSRDVWSVDNDPADVYGSDMVSVCQQPTLSTMETFAVAIGFGDISAFWAGSTCVLRFSVDYWNAHNFGFVLDKMLELVESPRMECSSLAATFHRYSQTYAFEIFKSYSSESVLSLLNNPFGDCMVDCRGEPVLLSASLLEQMPSRFRSFALEFASNFSVSASYPVEFFSNPSFAVTVYSNVFDTQVNSEKIFRSERFCFWNFNCSSKIKLSISENKIGLSSDFVDSRFLIGSYLNWDFPPSSECEYGNVFQSFPRENPWIVNYGSMQIKCWLNGFVSLKHISDFADGSYGHLRREVELFSDFSVNEVMELPIVEHFGLKRCFGYGVAGFVEVLHCLFKFGKLCFIWNEFNQDCLLHQDMESITPYLKVSQFLPCLKDMGILGGF